MLGVMMVMRGTMIIGVDAVRDLKMILWRCIGGFKTLLFISDQYQLDDPLDVPLALEGALKQLTIHSFWVLVKLVCFGCNPDWGFVFHLRISLFMTTSIGIPHRSPPIGSQGGEEEDGERSAYQLEIESSLWEQFLGAHMKPQTDNKAFTVQNV